MPTNSKRPSSASYRLTSCAIGMPKWAIIFESRGPRFFQQLRTKNGKNRECEVQFLGKDGRSDAKVVAQTAGPWKRFKSRDVYGSNQILKQGLRAEAHTIPPLRRF